MKKELDNIGLDPVMIKPNTTQTLKLFTLADVDKNLYSNIITPPTLTAPPLSPELTAEFNQIQEHLRALYRSVHASYVGNFLVISTPKDSDKYLTLLKSNNESCIVAIVEVSCSLVVFGGVG